MAEVAEFQGASASERFRDLWASGLLSTFASQPHVAALDAEAYRRYLQLEAAAREVAEAAWTRRAVVVQWARDGRELLAARQQVAELLDQLAAARAQFKAAAASGPARAEAAGKAPAAGRTPGAAAAAAGAPWPATPLMLPTAVDVSDSITPVMLGGSGGTPEWRAAGPAAAKADRGGDADMGSPGAAAYQPALPTLAALPPGDEIRAFLGRYCGSGGGAGGGEQPRKVARLN